MKTNPFGFFTIVALSQIIVNPCSLVLGGSSNSNGNGNGNGNGNSNSSNSSNTSPSMIPMVPKGVFSVNPMLVREGTRPELSWDIIYPSSLTVTGGTTPLVIVKPPGSMIASRTVYATVQIVGTIATAGTSSSSSSSLLNTDARVSFNGGTYSQLFFGNQTAVNPAQSLYIKKMTANQSLNFGGRFEAGGQWGSFYTSESSNLQVVSLLNGATPPIPSGRTIPSYLKPYLDSAGKVKIGPLSILVMMELGEVDRNSPNFDLADQVLLVSFSTSHPNNGHGNNLDGVDSSNPGQGKGGPNGAVDPSGGVDDERK